MKYKSMYTRFFVLFLVVPVVLAGCHNHTPSPSETIELPQEVQEVADAITLAHQRLQEGTLRLKIYHVGDGVMYRYGPTVDMLISDSQIAEVIAVENGELQNSGSFFDRLQIESLQPVENDVGQVVCLCYVFETPEDGVIFTVAFNQNWSTPDALYYTVIINELEIQYNEMFYEFIRPYLTKDILDRWDAVLDYN